MPRPKLVEAIMQTSPDRKVKQLSDELDTLNADHEKLAKQIADLQREIDAGVDPDAILRAMATQKAVSNRAAKIRDRMSTTSSQLDLAKSEARRILRKKLISELLSRAEELVAHARRINIQPLEEAIGALREAGFEREARLMPSFPSVNRSAVISGELLDRFVSSLEMFKAQMEPAPAPSVQRKIARVVPVSSDVPEPKASPEPAKRRSLHNEPPQEDKTLVQFVRANVELPSGALSRFGDVVNVEPRVAESLLKNGAAVPVEQIGGK